MATRIEAEDAISFLTAAVRIPTDWHSPLMNAEDLNLRWPPETVIDPEEELWHGIHPQQDTRNDGAVGSEAEELWELQTYRRLVRHFADRVEAGSRLLSLGEFADALQSRFPESHAAGRVCGLLCPLPTRQRGMLDQHRLSWLDSAYFATQESGPDATTSVLAFRPPNLPSSQPWREFLLTTSETDKGSFDELAAIYDVLGMLAHRRSSLLSVSAQRRLCKVALPWARCRFVRHDGRRTREYLLVPVLTLFSRRATTQFRRTVTLTLFLLPHEGGPGPPLDATDLAALCHQSVWTSQRPPLPMLDGPQGLGGQYLAGPLHPFIKRFLATHERHLPGVFDAIMRRIILALGVVPITRNRAQSVRMLVAISRSRSAVFGSALHVEGPRCFSVWEQLTTMSPGELAGQVGKLLSFNAAREGREWLVSGQGFRLSKMRVTNPYEEDTNAIAFYNPMSRFVVNLMPKSCEEFPTSLKMGVAWLNLLAGTICIIKEVMRSYRYEVEQHRNRIERLRSSDDRSQVAAALKEVHKTTLAILEEIDVVYSFELVGQSYKAAHACVLEMDGVSQERDNLLKELEITTDLLRAEESDQLNADIAHNTRSTDDFTQVLLIATVVLAIVAIKDIQDWLRLSWWVWTLVALLLGLTLFFTRRKRRQRKPVRGRT